MSIDWKGLFTSKIMYANVLGVLIAVAGVFGITPEVTGQTAVYLGVAINILTVIFRMVQKDDGRPAIIAVGK